VHAAQSLAPGSNDFEVETQPLQIGRFASPTRRTTRKICAFTPSRESLHGLSGGIRHAEALPVARRRPDSELVWYEHLANDPAAAISLYEEVVGWKTQPFAEGSGYVMWLGAQGPLGGVMKLPEQAAQLVRH
jgi:hypothetical protein